MSTPLELSGDARRLLDGPYPCVLTTLRVDGQPVSTVLWCGRDEDDIVLSAGHDVVWLKRLRRDPRAALAILDPKDMLHALTIFGSVVAFGDDPDYALIHRLSQVYDGGPYEYSTPEEYERLTVTIRPERVIVVNEGLPAADG